MTTTTGTAEHPDVSEISDFTEGLLTPPRETELRQHLDACGLCADVHDSLTEIRGLLGDLPSPSRMPADVAERIDAALAAEALLDSTTPTDSTRSTSTHEALSGSAVDSDAASAPVSRETRDTASRNAEGRVSRETRIGSTPDGPISRPSGHPRGATGPGRPAANRRRRRGIASLAIGAVATVAAIGLGSLLMQPSGQSASDSAAEAAQQGDAQTFSDGTLSDQVAALVTGDASPEPERATPKGSVGAENDERSRRASPLRQPAPEVPACVQRGIDRDTPALGIKRGSYEGTGAYLVVLPHTSDPSLVSAYVVDASCVDKASTTKGDVLMSESYPRH